MLSSRSRPRRGHCRVRRGHGFLYPVPLLERHPNKNRELVRACHVATSKGVKLLSNNLIFSQAFSICVTPCAVLRRLSTSSEACCQVVSSRGRKQGTRKVSSALEFCGHAVLLMSQASPRCSGIVVVNCLFLLLVLFFGMGPG